jgi:uracil-DNA glycosylase
VSRRPFASSWSAGFVEDLAAAQIGETYNFYREGDGAARRRQRLRAYLDSRAGARYLLVGEAPGYRGTLVSGVPFTSERQLSGNAPGEASATVVHRVLVELGIENDVLLWNLVPTHPRRPGEPRSNRRPTHAEIADGAPFLVELAHDRRAIPVGRVAHARMGGPYIRHPSHGGAAEFRRALVDFVRG